MKQFWDERYSQEAFAYGEQPNQFLKTILEPLAPGTILFPAEGEGRNAVFAATLGWDVSAFDISEAGKKKALWLAEKHQVSLDYQVGELPELHFKQSPFDAIALIYAHFPANVKSLYHKALDACLRPGGMIILEAFSKKHIEYQARNQQVGGPKDLDQLYSLEELATDFSQYVFLQLEEKEIELKEGLYHNGVGSVVRFVGRKK